MRPDAAPIQYEPLLWRAAIVQLGIATQISVAPQLFATPAYAPILPVLPALAVLLLVGGAGSLLALAGVVPQRSLPLVLASAAVPLLLLAYNFSQSGVVTGSVGWTVEVLTLLYTAWSLARGRTPRLRPYVAMLGVMQLTQAMGMVAAADQFMNPLTYAQFGSYLWLFAPTFALAGAGILVSEARRSERALPIFAGLAALNLAVLVNVFAVTRVWTGVLSYGVMGVVLLIATPRRPGRDDASVLLGWIAAVIAAWDLGVWMAPWLGSALRPNWTMMPPQTALSLALVGAAHAVLFHSETVRARILGGGLAGVAAAVSGVSLALVLRAGLMPDVLAYLGRHPDEAGWTPAPAAAALITALAVGGFGIALRPRSRATPHVIAVIATAGIGISLLDLLAYMLDSPELLGLYDVVAVRMHAAVALAVVAVGASLWATARVAAGSVGERIFAGIYVLAIVVLLRSLVADGALVQVAALTEHPQAARVLSAADVARDVLLVLALTAAVWTALLVTRTITGPLGELHRAIASSRAGESGVQIRTTRQDEIGDAMREFDEMSATIAERTDALRSRSEQLARMNERYRAILQGQSDLGEAVVLLDDGTPREWNDALLRMTGYSEDRIRRLETLFALVPEDRRDDVSRIARLRAGELHRFEIPIKRADDTTIEVEAALMPLPGQGPRSQLALLRDITERKRAERALEELALHDALTGLANRSLFRDRAERTLRAASLAGDSFGIVYLDLDRFKQVNDAYGHDPGDALLKGVAERLRAAVPAGDTVARFGGDEFAILHPRSGAVGALAVLAQNVIEALRPPFSINGYAVYADASLGIVSYPLHGTDVATLLRRADVAMYSAKRGMHGWAVYALEEDARSRDRLALLADLRQATQMERIDVHFQPQISLRDGRRCRAVESLARWAHPTRGAVPPSEFIPLAEETGIINDLCRTVLRRALQACAGWRADGFDAAVAVNISMRDLRDGKILTTVTSALEEAHLPPSALIAEITESWMMLEPARAAQVLGELAARGVQISVDDFGTGYSSLVYLQRLPVNELKVDLRFVSEMLADPGSDAIVRSTIQLGHALGLTVVGEGAETPEILAALTDRGCDLAQGYAVARPLSLPDLRTWLTARRDDPTRPDAHAAPADGDPPP